MSQKGYGGLISRRSNLDEAATLRGGVRRRFDVLLCEGFGVSDNIHIIRLQLDVHLTVHIEVNLLTSCNVEEIPNDFEAT